MAQNKMFKIIPKLKSDHFPIYLCLKFIVQQWMYSSNVQ